MAAPRRIISITWSVAAGIWRGSLRPHRRISPRAARRRNDRHFTTSGRRGRDVGIDIGGTDDAISLRELFAQGSIAGAGRLRRGPPGRACFRIALWGWIILR